MSSDSAIEVATGPVVTGLVVTGPVVTEPVVTGHVKEEMDPFIARCEQYASELPLVVKGEIGRSLSIQDEMDKSDAFHTMKPGSYEIFACHHQMSYALYCSLDGTVWMFEVDCQTPQTRSIVTLADLYPWTR